MGISTRKTGHGARSIWLGLMLGTTALGTLRRVTVGGSVSWQSSTYYQQSGEPYFRADQPAYALVGLMMRYAFDNGLSLSANVNNLFDKTYMPGLGSYGTGVYGDPRSFLISAKYRF